MNVSMRSDSLSVVVCSSTSILGDLKSVIELVAIDSTHPNWASSWSIIFSAEVIKKGIFKYSSFYRVKNQVLGQRYIF